MIYAAVSYVEKKKQLLFSSRVEDIQEFNIKDKAWFITPKENDDSLEILKHDMKFKSLSQKSIQQLCASNA